METTKLKSICESIGASIKADQIYAFSSASANNPRILLIIGVNPPPGTKLSALAPLVGKELYNQRDINFQLYMTSEIKRLAKNGHLLILAACTPENAVYLSDEYPQVPTPDINVLSNALDQAKKDFEQRMEKAGETLQAFKFYDEQNEHAQSIFMLHQFAITSLKAFEAALFVFEKRSNELSIHQNLIGEIFPEFYGFMFDPYSAKERELLEAVQSVYKSFSTGNQNHVDLSKIVTSELQKKFTELNSFLKTKFLLIHSFVQKRQLEMMLAEKNMIEVKANKLEDQDEDFDETNDECTEHEPIARFDERYELLIQAVAEKLQAKQIFLVADIIGETLRGNAVAVRYHNYRNSHYIFLVISDLPQPYGIDFFSQIENYPAKKLKATLLIHTMAEVKRKLAAGDFFFNSLMDDFHQLMSVDLPELKPCGEVAEPKPDHQFARLKLMSAETLMALARECVESLPELSLSLMNQAIEQCCLLIMRSQLYYSPNHHSLHHLLSVCSVIHEHTRQTFYLADADKKLLNMLCGGFNAFRYSQRNGYGDRNVYKLFEKCQEFLQTLKREFEETAVNNQINP